MALLRALRRPLAVVAAFLALSGAPAAGAQEATHSFGEMVAYPLVFPVGGEATTGARTGFWDSRADGTHHAQDILAPKLTPVYAVADGTITHVNYSRNSANLNVERCCTLILAHDDGWESWYIHLNNDTPGTDDGRGWGIADGILPGTHVAAGDVIGYVGDSGNCDTMAGCPPHLHFELRDPAGVIVDAFESLRAAEGLAPACEPADPAPLGRLLAGTGLLRQGDSGPAVYELQGFLRLQGFDPGPLDGTYSAQMQEAVRLFQQRRRLAADGVLGPQTRASILALSRAPGFQTLVTSGGVLLQGNRGPEVRELKRWLRTAGYEPGSVGPRYTVGTVAAVVAFQQATPVLQVDGVFGPATRAALLTALHLTWPGDC